MNSTIKIQSRFNRDKEPPRFISDAERRGLPLADLGKGEHPRLDVNKTQRRLHDDLDRLLGKKID